MGADSRYPEQDGWDTHAAFFDRLVEQGIVILGGPIASSSGEDVALLAVKATNEQALRSMFSTDPWAANQVLRIKEIRPWTLWLDGRQRCALTGDPPAEGARAGGSPVR